MFVALLYRLPLPLTPLQLQEQAKKDARAARFGLSTQPKTKNEPKLSQEDEELKKKREAKFGPVEVGDYYHIDSTLKHDRNLPPTRSRRYKHGF